MPNNQKLSGAFESVSEKIYIKFPSKFTRFQKTAVLAAATVFYGSLVGVAAYDKGWESLKRDVLMLPQAASIAWHDAWH